MARTLIIGASGGIGSALVRGCGSDVLGLSRSDGFDLSDPASLAGVAPFFDRVIVATGALAPPGAAPEKSLAAIHPRAMADIFAINTIGPALVLAQVARLLPRDRRSVVGVLSARVGSIGDNRIGGWHSYRASKAALNQVIRGAAIELSRTRKQAICVALHPGTVDTPFTQAYAAPKVTADEAAANLLAVLDGLTVKETGGFYDYAGRPIPW